MMFRKAIILTLGTLITLLGIFACVQNDDVSPELSRENGPEAMKDISWEAEAPVIRYASAKVIDGHYIVVFRKEALQTFAVEAEVTKTNHEIYRTALINEAQRILRENKISSTIEQSYVKAVQGVAVTLSVEEVEKLRRDGRIAYIEEDQMIHVSMGGPPSGGGGGGSGQTVPWGVARVGGAIDGTNAGRAWIIDSGIDLDHPDLNVNTALSSSFLSGRGASSADDENGHGTHVAGTVGAIDNTIGVIGVAAGAELVAVRVLDRRGSGTVSGVIAGVDYVAVNASGGDAANMSLGGGVSTALDQAVINASATCPFAIAAGNESQHANNSSPARANGPNIYTVSSMANGDVWSSFSNYGNPPVDYCAPGSSIYSTYKGGGYNTLSGTSMASPHVCGILLIGGITTDGAVSGDPDGNPDPIAHH